jgi:4-hydroxybenzoate polyprenyltransferase
LPDEEDKKLGVLEIIGILYGQGIPMGTSFKNRFLGFICIQRPAIAIMGPLMFLAAGFQALGRLPSCYTIVMGFIAVYAFSAAEHTIDDTIDKEIDKKKWPTRPLPTETISRLGSTLFAFLLASIGIVISYLVFNWQLVAVELFALGLGTLYPFLRDRIGYLVLTPIPALIAIGGWVAYTPDTLFTSPVPWILYMVYASWQAFHILTLPWAIGVAKTFIVRPKEPRTVVIMSIIISVITLVLAIYLSIFIPGTWIFIITMIALSIVFWLTVLPLLDDPTDLIKSLRAVMVATNYNIVMCVVLMWVVV